jgi:SpoVK/Ycf46/Vps4 family AAA+-type ATPase
MICIKEKEIERRSQFAENKISFEFLLCSNLDKIIGEVRNIQPFFSVDPSIFTFEKKISAKLQKLFPICTKLPSKEMNELLILNIFESGSKNMLDRCIISESRSETESEISTTLNLKRSLFGKNLDLELELLDLASYNQQTFKITIDFKIPDGLTLSPKEISNIFEDILFKSDANRVVVLPVCSVFDLPINLRNIKNQELIDYLFISLDSQNLQLTLRISEIEMMDPKTKASMSYHESFLLLGRHLVTSCLFRPEKNLHSISEISQQLKKEMRVIKRYEQNMMNLCKKLYRDSPFLTAGNIMILLEVKKGSIFKNIISYICMKQNRESDFEWFDLNMGNGLASMVDQILSSSARIKIIDHIEVELEGSNTTGASLNAKKKQLLTVLSSIKNRGGSSSTSFYIFLTNEFSGKFDAKSFDIIENLREFTTTDLQNFHTEFLLNSSIQFEDLLSIKYLFTENDIITILKAHNGALANGFTSEISSQYRKSQHHQSVSLDEFHLKIYQENFIREDKSDRNSIARSTKYVKRRHDSLKHFVHSEEYIAHLKNRLATDKNIGTTVEKIPKVHWSDIGGLDEVKDELLKILKVSFTNIQPLKQANKISEVEDKIEEFNPKEDIIHDFNKSQLQGVLKIPRKYSEITKFKNENHPTSFENMEVVDIDQSIEVDFEKISNQLGHIDTKTLVKRNTIQVSKTRPRKGVIFFGPPGTGKTLLAKCLANESKSSFISIKGPELLNMYVGESEKNMRDVFLKAKNSCPCILFFDELDSLLPRRGTSGDSGNVTDRLVAQFLTELENSPNDLLVIAATNRPDLLDSSILTSGKFDKKIYLGIFNKKEQRINILRSLTKDYQFEEGLHHESLEEICPQFMTGADFYSVVAKTVKLAIKRIETIIEEFIVARGLTIASFKSGLDEYQKQINTKVVLSIEDFRAALSGFKQSVAELDRAKYEKLAKEFADIIIG